MRTCHCQERKERYSEVRHYCHQDCIDDLGSTDQGACAGSSRQGWLGWAAGVLAVGGRLEKNLNCPGN